MNRRRLLLALAVAASVLGPGCKRDSPATERAPIRVAAAADLTAAFEELGPAFERASGQQVTFSFGSTGLYARQIAQGAPFDLFAAANVSYAEKLAASGVCDGATVAPYARGRLAIWAKAAAPGSIAELADPRFVRIAIANPEHAPYGIAAKEALVAAGIWKQLEPRVVYGENVRQTLQLAETGNVEAAIVALSLVVLKKDGAWSLVDERLHAPIDQALVVCRNGARQDGGRAFAAFVNGAEGRQIMRRYGFLLPGESLASAR